MDKPVTEVKVPVPWGYITGKWWGDTNKVPIVCVHGWQDNAGTFDPLMELMPSDTSFYCIDLPGHGLSSHLPEGISYYLYWDGVICLRRIVKYFKWNRISIMGHSLGGGIGFLYAASFPNETDLLISLDVMAPIALNKPENIVKSIPTIIDSFLEHDQVKDTKDPVDKYEEMLNTVMVGHNNTLTRESCEILMKRGMRPFGEDTYKFSRDNRVKTGWLGKATPDLIVQFARNITCRYLNIKAMPGSSADNWPMYQHLMNIIDDGASDSRFFKVTGCHHVHLNEPNKVAPLINDFLTS